ncbi:RagB/SusD family nutrient uptake outer membrane protein [Fulvivirgaceae bacterium PWU4]|uniref:RagB/SusD family nutrient uptake outer membrane protein n=1 Tax=Chryseosolibacter histidini TaxID=2782349 RepID=A0AAP2DQJ6_9BACT|nr:RagB/SusD family nutrient uptake outer membrane protein [Chryseosolibacter histidini]MBT1700668.1 RagB/SusD family nutrient uptake outer membrane protein [Chryseosolibacter histidini]
MKRIYKRGFAVLAIGALMFGPIACKDSFLEVPATGQLNETQIQSAKGIESLLVGVYSVLNGRGNGWHSGASNWMWGSMRGGEANKGTNAGDFNSMNPVERYELNATNSEVHGKWLGDYEGVARANFVLANVTKVTDMSDDDKKRVTGEARFLRGHYYFDLKKNFGNVPYIDETVNTSDKKAISIKNDTDIWPKIEDDFKFAYENLPEKQAQVGRANKWAAGAYYGKALLFQKKYTQALAVFNEVISKGQTSDGKKYALVPRFEDVFKGEMENHSESVFAFQAAAGTGDINNTNQDLAMNYPYNTGPSGPGECCGFFAPSFDLVDSYRTNGGLPYLNNEWRSNAALRLVTDQGIQSSATFQPDQGAVDPRLDLTIGRRYFQFLDWMPHPGFDWIRDQSYAGPYTQKKYSYRKSDKGKYQDGSSWTPGYHAINFMIIRFADVLLMAAECEIEAGSVPKGVEYINMVRTRAANPGSFLKGKLLGFTDGDPKKPILDFNQNAANYDIATYGALTQSEARSALRMERKLELALEGHRFYDLVRWGIDDTELNSYLVYEASKIASHFGGPQAVYGPEDDLLPIPQRQRDLMGPEILAQNPGF